MRLLFFIFFYLIVATKIFAQNKMESFAFFNDMKGNRIVVVDTAILHVGPSEGAATTDTLFFGEVINILMQVPYFVQINELDIPWLKITYFKKGYTKVSYILAQKVSLTKTIKVNDTKWLTVLHQKTNTLNYSLLLLSIIDKSIEKKVEIPIPENFLVDSVQLNLSEQNCLKNATSMLALRLISNKKTEGVLSKYIIVCNDNQIVQLPFIHNYYHAKYKAEVIEKVYFPSQNVFKISLKILSKKNKETITKYKWQDCNYINL